MTIKQFLSNSEKQMAISRLTKLKEIKAPKVIIASLEKIISNWDSEFKVGGQKELLELEYKKHEKAAGNGGNFYLRINGDVLYFPQARFGRFTKRF